MRAAPSNINDQNVQYFVADNGKGFIRQRSQ